MLYKTEAVPVVAEGFAETTNFTIPATEKSFKSLINNIYSRKKEAPVRELSTNAFDAHIEAGIIRPFRLKLPSKLDPLFMVRDFGLGMSHDFVMTKYPQLFTSTKDKENVQVGMKGLGSKSPFAYTDAFTLRIFSGETVRTYSTYIGANGVPQLAFQGETPSTEERGTAVQFPVEMQDIEEFHEVAIRVLKGFTMLPEGLPQTVIDAVQKHKPDDTGSFWKIYHKDYLGKGMFARQGCVLYPIELDKIPGTESFRNLEYSVVVDFPIGTVEMTDSREMLSLDDETKANIQTRLKEMTDEIDAKVQARFSVARTAWELRDLLAGNLFSGFNSLYRSSPVYQRASAIDEAVSKGLPSNAGERSKGTANIYSVVVANRDVEEVYYHRRQYGVPTSLPKNPLFIYIGNLDAKQRRGMNARIGNYLRDKGLTRAYVLDRLRLSYYRRIGCPPVLRLLDLPPLPKAERLAADRKPWERFKGWNKHGTLVNIDDADLDDNCVFAFLNKNSVMQEPGRPAINTSELYGLDRLFKQFGGKRIVLINVRLNEKLDRWPEDRYPRVYGAEDGLIDALTRSQITMLINILNMNRFENTIYASALGTFCDSHPKKFKKIREALKLNQSNPLFDLVRFHDRYEAIPKVKRTNLDGAMEDGYLKKHLDQIIDIGLSFGLEVLPPSCGVWGRLKFPYPLLPKKWEAVATYLGARGSDVGDLFNVVKEISKC